MIEINQILLNATKADKNGRIFTKEAWDSIIESEQNKNHTIPVVSYPNANFDFSSISLQDMVGEADLSWFRGNINVHLVLIEDKWRNIDFMPNFAVNEENIKNIDGVEVISKCFINCFFATERPATQIDG